jgi:ABC-type transporter Mla maintaining outer membrane lipid asymmetry ATPase subunit MlaF
VATHAAERNSDGEPRIVAADASKLEQADFLMLKDADVVFEGSADDLRQSQDPYLKTFLS